jgi:hypothetical protein
MGGMVIGECKDCQIKSYIVQTNYKHSNKRYGRLPLGDVYIGHGFLPKMGKFEKKIPKHFFISLLKDLSIEALLTLGKLLSTEFMEPNR